MKLIYEILIEATPQDGCDVPLGTIGAAFPVYVPAETEDIALNLVRNHLKEEKFNLKKIEHCCVLNLKEVDFDGIDVSEIDLMHSLKNNEIIFGLIWTWTCE